MIRTARTRRGWTLIELAVTMSVGSAMVGIAVSVLYFLLMLDRDSRESLGQRTALANMVRCFRDDVHAATGFKHADPPAEESTALAVWELTIRDGHVIQYQRTADGLRRVERVAGDLLGQEAFALPPDVAVAVELLEEGHATMVSLAIAPNDRGSETGPARTVRVDAVLGADHRFATHEEP